MPHSFDVDFIVVVCLMFMAYWKFPCLIFLLTRILQNNSIRSIPEEAFNLTSLKYL